MGSKKKDSFMWFDLYVCLITKNYTLPEREFNEHFNKVNRGNFVTFCKSDYNSYNIYAIYISFVYKLPMVIYNYHSKSEVSLQSASFENFEAFKKYAMG